MILRPCLRQNLIGAIGGLLRPATAITTPIPTMCPAPPRALKHHAGHSDYPTRLSMTIWALCQLWREAHVMLFCKFPAIRAAIGVATHRITPNPKPSRVAPILPPFHHHRERRLTRPMAISIRQRLFVDLIRHSLKVIVRIVRCCCHHFLNICP